MTLAILVPIMITIAAQLPQQSQPPRIYEEKAENILEEARDVITSYESLFIEFNYQTVDAEMAGDIDNTEAHLYTKGDKYHMVLEGRNFISDGTTVWVYMEEVNEVHISYAEDADDSMTPTSLVENFADAYRSKWIREERFGERSIHIIDLVPKEPQVFFKFRLALDTDTYHIVYTEAYDRQGGIYRYEVTAFETNPETEEGLFSFDPGNYPDIEVIDLR